MPKVQKRVIRYIVLACAIALTVTFYVQPALEKRATAEQDGTEATLYAHSYDLMPALFKEPFETIYFFSAQGMIFGFSTHTAGSITAPVDSIVQYIRKRGCGLEDILLIVHNHWQSPRFTECDIRSYWDLRRRGFNGRFAVYVQSSGRMIFYERK